MSERSFREPRRRGFDNDFAPARPRGQRAAAIPTAARRQPASAPPIRATVKWFSPDKGFGFVVLDDGSSDAFLHASVVEQSGRSGAELQPGMVLQVRVGQGQRGAQVTDVLAVEEGAAAQAPARATRPAFAQTTPGRS